MSQWRSGSLTLWRQPGRKSLFTERIGVENTPHEKARSALLSPSLLLPRTSYRQTSSRRMLQLAIVLWTDHIFSSLQRHRVIEPADHRSPSRVLVLPGPLSAGHLPFRVNAGLLSSIPRSWKIVFAVIVAHLVLSEVSICETTCFDTRRYLLLQVDSGLPTVEGRRTPSLCLRCLSGLLALWPSASAKPQKTPLLSRKPR